MLVWPRLLELPSDKLKIVYFDLNHWIYLAQASTGHSNGTRFAKALEACQAAKSAETAIFVLSATHYMEMHKIKDPAQRKDIAAVMEELTDFASVVDRVVVMTLELDAMLDQFSREPSTLYKVSLLGRGVRHSFGRSSGMRIVGPRGDATDEVRRRMGAEAFDDFVAKAELDLSRSVLQGPHDEEELEELRALGWKPESAIQVAENRAEHERKLTSALSSDSSFRRNRLRDAVSARELCIEFESILPRALAGRHLALSDVLLDQEQARQFVRAMPSTEVSIEIKTAWHRNPTKPWTANDVYDIDALSLAVPYCDIVVTEKACNHVLNAAHLGKRTHTALLRDLKLLPRTLEEWQPKRAPRETEK